MAPDLLQKKRNLYSVLKVEHLQYLAKYISSTRHRGLFHKVDSSESKTFRS